MKVYGSDKLSFNLLIKYTDPMFLDFFILLKRDGLPVTLREYLSMLEALDKGFARYNVEEFYYLARTAMVKHEHHLDRFDQLFGMFFQGMNEIPDDFFSKIPEEWLKKNQELLLSEEMKQQIEAMGGLEKLMERFKELMEEQKERHEGGNKWIGTGGTSPFGAYGYNPEGFRAGQEGSRNRRGIKVWDKRQFANLNDKVELDTRNLKMALRRLRLLTREGRDEELDLPSTIRETSRNAGWLDLKMVPVRKNNIKILLLLDIGGSMDDHVEICARLFSAAKYEFKHLEYYYFHNCLYERLWKDNRRRFSEATPTMEVLHKFNSDYKIIYVGDASMSPYEIMYAGGSVEHWNDEAGIVWLKRMQEKFPSMVWLNPVPEEYWKYTQSIQILKEYMHDQMFPLTIEGITNAVKSLKKAPGSRGNLAFGA